MRRARLLMIALVLFFSVGCDQVTKIAAREHLQGEPTASYLGDVLRVVYAENSGAFLSLGASLPDGVRLALLVGAVGLFLLGLAIWLVRARGLSSRATVAMTLVLGGGIGNLIDRVLFDGHVTDFLNLGIGPVRTGIFNVADVWIVLGVAMMVIAPEMWGRDEEAQASGVSARSGARGHDAPSTPPS